MKPYAIYLRKSRLDLEAETHGQGDTLARHEKILTTLAQQQGYPLGKIYAEVVSGESIASRPQMQQLLQDIENEQWTGVLVMEVERLARGDTIDQGLVAQTFKYSGTLIITPSKVYDPNNEFDEEYFEFGLYMSRREYKTINRRQQMGRLQSVREGRFVGNVPPYGYDRIKNPQGKGYTLAPNPQEAPVVQLVFECFIKGLLTPQGGERTAGTTMIAHHLNGLGIPTRKGGRWTGNTIRGILENPTYIGKVRWNERKQVKKMVDGVVIHSRPRSKLEDRTLVDGLHPPIIAQSVWEESCKLREQNGSHIPLIPSRTLQNPLSGLVRCGLCGHMLVRRPSKKADDFLLCVYPGCPCAGSYLEMVEEAVLTSLAHWTSLTARRKQGALENATVTIAALEATQGQLSGELDELNQQLTKLFDFLERGVYDESTFLHRRGLLEERIAKASEEQQRLTEQLERAYREEANRVTLLPNVQQTLEEYYRISDPTGRNKLLKAVLEEVTYEKIAGGPGHQTDFTVELHLRNTK